MTTLLLNDEVDFLRSIRKTAIVLMAMGLIDRRYPGRAVRVDEMAGILELDPRTVDKHMSSLATRGRLLFNGTGYVLTDGGRALILGSNLDTSSETQALAQSPALVAGTQQAQAQPLSASPNGGGENAQNVLHTMCALKEEEKESLTLSFKKDSPPPSQEGAQNVHTSAGSACPTTAQILAATPILFGEPGVVTQGLGDLELIEPHYALGWVAHAYACRRTSENPRGLYAPAGLVYQKLRHPDHPQPRANCYVAPEKYLPDEYLSLLGLIEYQCEVCNSTEVFLSRAALDQHIKHTHPLMAICEICGQRFINLDQLDSHMAADHPEPADPFASADLSVNEQIPNRTLSPVQAWDAVQAQLQMEMPRASFQTWVQDSAVTRYDGNVFFVAARNAYARDWLESRLASTVNRLLIGILDTSDVHVQFVVSEVCSE